jgi:hypothetical protein
MAARVVLAAIVWSAMLLVVLALGGCAAGPIVMGLSAAASVSTIARDAVQIDEALAECNPAKAPPYVKWLWHGCR